MRVKILKRFWRFLFVSVADLPRGADGECDDPTTPDKSIRVWEKLQGERQLAVTVHETLHAADWHKSEEWIEEVSNDLARILWRLGYRRQ